MHQFKEINLVLKGNNKQHTQQNSINSLTVCMIGLQLSRAIWQPVKGKVTQSCLTLCDPWNSPGQNTGVCSLSLLQEIFPTQGSDPGLPHCRQILYQLSIKGSPWQPVGYVVIEHLKQDWSEPKYTINITYIFMTLYHQK